MQISPKAIVAFLIPFIAAVVLYLVTGDSTYLVGLLIAAATGGGAVLAPPAPGVTQRQVKRISRR